MITDRICIQCGHDKCIEYSAINWQLPRIHRSHRVAGLKARCCNCGHSWWVDAGGFVRSVLNKPRNAWSGAWNWWRKKKNKA